jgi:hypothetical protein
MPSTSRSPLNPLQAAILTRLRADATLTAMLAKVKDQTPPTPAIVDNVKEGQPFPYVRLGEHNSVPDNDHSGFGRNITETLHVWTKAAGNFTGQNIADRITELLDHQPAALSALLASAGHRVVSIRSEFDQALTDPDPQIRHHVLRFRVVTAQTS